MTKLVKHPLLPDSIKEVSLREPDAEERVRKHYEDGRLVILRDFRLDLDYDVLCSVDFDVEGPPEFLRKVKKFPMERMRAVEPAAYGPLERFIFERIFGSDTGRLRHFCDQVASGDRQVDALVKRLFPHYRAYKGINTWRFTETVYENLHWDNFGIDDDFHQVRVFCNLDSRPRLWRVSEDFETFVGKRYADLGLGRYAADTPDRFVSNVNNKVLGGLEAACHDLLPKHHLAFEQGEVWLCETRMVSHQIYSGYRACAAMYYIDPDSMQDPSLRFSQRVQRLHAEHA